MTQEPLFQLEEYTVEPPPLEAEAVGYPGDTVWLIVPLNGHSANVLRELAPEDAAYVGDGLAVEWRYLEDVCIGLEEFGFTIK